MNEPNPSWPPCPYKDQVRQSCPYCGYSHNVGQLAPPLLPRAYSRPLNHTLTERQRLVLDFIVACLTADGRCPTLREIGSAIGIRSTNGVDDHLHALERKGYVVREMIKARSITVIRLSDGTAVRGKYVFEKTSSLTE